MASDERLLTFIEGAKTRGASDETVAALLRTEGWSARAVNSALREHYERALGMPVPSRGEAAESARDAFLYLLAFCTLGTWTVALASLVFTLLNRWFADAVFDRTFGAHSVATELASIIVAFPVYLWVMHTIGRGVRSNPERLDAGVTKWLTWLALLITAGILIGDLVTFLSFLLRGELTVRFVLKVLAVLVIAGGVFWYYVNFLRNGAVGIARLAVIASSAAVVAIVATGLANLGSPAYQRALEADRLAVQEMTMLEARVQQYWTNNKALPRTLETRRGVRYLSGTGSSYQLCAEFQQASDEQTDEQWWHPAGSHCFNRDASIPVR